MYHVHSLSDPNQIAANRRGEITAEQRTTLQGETNYGCAGLFVSLILLPIIFVTIGGVVWYYDLNRSMPAWGYGLIAGVFVFILVIAIVPQLWRAFNAWRVRQELTAGQLETLDGQVNWRRSKYVAETPGKRLRIPALAGGLMPGSYRFSFLPSTGWIVSAERTTPPGGEDPRAELAGVLAQVHGYSIDSLEANRQGRMSAGQITRLLLAAVWQGIVGVIILLVIAALAYLIYTTLNRQQREWAIVAGLAVEAITILILAWRLMTLGLDAVRGSVMSAEGAARRDVVVTHTSKGGTSTSYYYRLGNLSFSISNAAYTAFIDGLQYRIYYAPLSKRLIAIEPL